MSSTVPSFEPALRVPLAVARALRTMAVHPSVVDVRVNDGDAAGTWVRGEILIRTELPSAWRAAGQSPSGVRAVEPVTIVFPVGYPASAPIITLRPDFDRSHPHIQPGRPENPPVPCLVAGSPREVVQARGILGLVEQLVEWLDKASTLSLNDPRHGWEPVRRDHLDDLVLSDANRLRSIVTAAGGCASFLTTYLHTKATAGDLYRIDFEVSTPVAISPDLPKRLTRRQFGDGEWVGTGLALVAWPGKTPGGAPRVADRYFPETVTSIATLLERADAYSCRDVLEAKLSLLARRLAGAPITIVLPLTVVLLARRPFPLVGTSSPIEICAYVVEFGSAADLAPGAPTPVRLAGHRDTVSIAVLRRASGDDAAQARSAWTLLGCGSVGSKLALHLGRTGRGPGVLVDRDTLEPHNFARHATLPISADTDGLFFRSKTFAVAQDLDRLGQRPTSYRQDVVAMLANTEGRSALAPAGTATVVNTTGSLVVREAFAFARWPDDARPRGVEACLLGAGRVGYLSVEGPFGNPSASDLAAEAYQVLRGDDALRDTVFGAEAEAIAVGQGCSAVTFPMSDTRLSALTAALSDAIAKLDREGLPTAGGELVLGQVQPDGLSQAWSRSVVHPWTVVERGAPDAPGVRVSPRVTAAIKAAVARSPGSETGGVLIGRFSQTGNAFQVVDVLDPPPDSTFSAEKFVLGVEGLRPKIAKVIASSRGALYAIGTWHNHLVPSGPSRTDARTARLLAIDQLFPLLMLIDTPDGYRALTAEAIDRRYAVLPRPGAEYEAQQSRPSDLREDEEAI